MTIEPLERRDLLSADLQCGASQLPVLKETSEADELAVYQQADLVSITNLSSALDAEGEHDANPDDIRVVNVITHGLGNGFFPEFLNGWNHLRDVLLNAPNPRSGLEGRVSVYRADWESSDGWFTAAAWSGLNFVFQELARREMLEDDPSQLLILGLEKAQNIAANLAQSAIQVSRAHAQDAANTILSDLIDQGFLDEDPLLSQLGQERIHLIGHSRGAAVNARLAQLLVARGYKIDQFTALDGYSFDWPQGANALADFNITGLVNPLNDNVNRRVSYMVEEGLQEILPSAVRFMLIYLAAVSDGEATGVANAMNDLLDNLIEPWRAPPRADFQNILIKGTEEVPSNHVNLVGSQGEFQGYYLEPNYLYDNFLGQNRDMGLHGMETPDLPPTAGDNGAAAGEASPEPVSDFYDGSFSGLDELIQDIANLDFSELGLEWINTILEVMQRPEIALQTLWRTSGDVQLISTGENGGVLQLTQTVNTSASYFFSLANSTGHVAFDLETIQAGPDDKLLVLQDGVPVGEIDLAGLPAGRHAFPLYAHAGTGGYLTLQLTGPESDRSKVRLDNFAITPHSTNPIQSTDVNDDQTVDIRDVLTLIGDLRLNGFREISVEQLAAGSPLQFVDVDGDLRVGIQDLLAIINRLRQDALGGEGMSDADPAHIAAESHDMVLAAWASASSPEIEKPPEGEPERLPLSPSDDDHVLPTIPTLAIQQDTHSDLIPAGRATGAHDAPLDQALAELLSDEPSVNEWSLDF